MSGEVPMSALEEAEFFFHCARCQYLLAEKERRFHVEPSAEVPPEDLAGTVWDPTLPALLRRQAG